MLLLQATVKKLAVVLAIKSLLAKHTIKQLIPNHNNIQYFNQIVHIKMMNKLSFLTGGITSNNENLTKLSNKPPVAKRKALGDITNAYNDDDNKEVVVKKPQVALAQDSMVGDEMTTVSQDNRVYMQRPCDDIDSRDNDNPLLVTCYVNEIYEHFNNVEKEFMVNSNYMNKQEFINEKMRAILIDWLVRICFS